jgi:hypothetical protein
VTADEVSWLIPTPGGGYPGTLQLSEAGFYQVMVQCYFTFPAASPIAFVRTSMNIGFGRPGNHQWFHGPVPDFNGNKQFSYSLPFGPLWSNGFAMIQPIIDWTPEVASATAGALTLVVTKLT